MEIQLHCSLVSCVPSHLISSILRLGREFSFNDVNLCESNVVQTFELIFCDSER